MRYGDSEAFQKPAHDAGFTLIETLVVIVVLGILAATVVLGVQNLTTSSAASACQADFKSVETAQQEYFGQTGRYAIAPLDLTVQAVGSDGSEVGPWLKQVPNSTRYQIGIDTSVGPDFGNVTVAVGLHGPSDGNSNCAYA